MVKQPGSLTDETVFTLNERQTQKFMIYIEIGQTVGVGEVGLQATTYFTPCCYSTTLLTYLLY